MAVLEKRAESKDNTCQLARIYLGFKECSASSGFRWLPGPIDRMSPLGTTFTHPDTQLTTNHHNFEQSYSFPRYFHSAKGPF
jgi:hypothetical protein